MSKAKSKSKPSKIYAVHNGEFTKIGYSVVLKSRLSSLQSSNSEELTLIGLMDGGRDKELAIHRKVKKLWRRGEWFDLGSIAKAKPRLKRLGFNLRHESLDKARALSLRETRVPNGLPSGRCQLKRTGVFLSDLPINGIGLMLGKLCGAPDKGTIKRYVKRRISDGDLLNRYRIRVGGGVGLPTIWWADGPGHALEACAWVRGRLGRRPATLTIINHSAVQGVLI